jgi:hypothetical protein
MKFEFHPEALEEYKDAARYYEGCQSGLGHRFIASVEQAILYIIEKPEQCWSVMKMGWVSGFVPQPDLLGFF